MLRTNSFSSLYQVSRDNIQWESAAALVKQLTAVKDNGASGPADSTTTAEKWLAEAKKRQERRLAADAAARSQTGAQGTAQQAGGGTRRGAAANSGDDGNAARSISVQVHQAGKSVVDRSTGGIRVLLHPVSISLFPGELTAVIGPSGSGKSTWLGLLTGRAQPTTGRITVFGRDLNREFATVKRSLSAVPQMDAFLTSLKVRTSLYYSACLRLPANTPHVQLVARVESVLGSVGLDECGDRRISQLSGGQLRRLSLAQELLSDPDVLYLDEVTSGLDEQSDAAIMALLRTLSLSGRTIMIITHHLHNLQDNCHKLVVLAAGGYMVFYGSPKEACDTFHVANATEVLPAVKAMAKEDIIARCQDNSAESDWSPPPNNQLPPVAAKSHRPARHIADFVVLVKRQLAVLVSSPLSTLMSIVICMMIGLLLVISYPNMKVPVKPKEPNSKTITQKEIEKYEKSVKDYAKNLEINTRDSSSIVFILAISSFFLGCLAGTRELVMERRLFWRESGTEMSVWSYLAAKLFVHSILTSIQASCLGAAVVVWVQADCSPMGVALANIAVGISGLCMGFLISAASRSDAVATKLMLLAVLPQMILSGALSKEPPVTIKWLSKILITSHYAFQNKCGLFPLRIRDNLAKPQYSLAVLIAVAVVHSLLMLGATVYFLKKTASGEDPSRGE